MRNIVLIVLFIVSKTINAQNKSPYFNGGIKYYECGNVSVKGNKLTVEAIVKLNGQDGKYTIRQFSDDVVSKHRGAEDCEYLLRPNHAQLTTTKGWFYTPYKIDSEFYNDSTYHIAMVYDGSLLKFYVNGCIYSQTKASGNIVTNKFNTRIGNIAGRSPITDEQLNGYVDEVRIWNVARSESEILSNIKDLPNPQSHQGLLAYYKFDGSLKNLQGNPEFNPIAYGNPKLVDNSIQDLMLGKSTTQSFSICENGTIQLTKYGNAKAYLWSTNEISKSINVSKAGIYWVETNNVECKVKDTFNVIVIKKPSIEIGKDISIYDGDSIQIQVKSDGNYDYNWRPNKHLSSPNSNITYAFPNSTTTYVLEAKNNICSSQDSFKIIVNYRPIILENVLYDFDKATVKPESYKNLDSLVNILIKYPEMRIELSCHTDNIGGDKYNLDLSQKRAQSVVNYIVNKGVSSERLIAKGYGETRSIAPNIVKGKDNPKGRAKNRRTEFKILNY